MIRPVSPPSMQFKDEALFMGRHAPTLEARVEVVDPAQPAALACPVESCMEIQKGSGEARIESVREVDTCFCDLARMT